MSPQMDQSKDDQPTEGEDDQHHQQQQEQHPDDEEGDEEERNSDASSPEPVGPLQPLFSVRFTDEVTKNGDVVCYRIQVTKVRH